jgi:folate-dependent phosphoribosylglycinamide formyltransferase PurN
MMRDECIAVFAYAFPHRKTQDFLFELALAGFQDVLVLAAPWKKLPNSPSEPHHRTGLTNAEPNDTATICAVLGFDYFETEHSDFGTIRSLCRERRIKLAIIAGARIIKSAVIGIFEEGVLNIHPGKIPETSGLDAFFYTIKHNTPAGASAHFIDGRVDAGDLLFFEETEIGADDTPEIVQHNVYQSQIRALRRFISHWENGALMPSPVDPPRKNDPMTAQEKAQAIRDFSTWRCNRVVEQAFHVLIAGCESGETETVMSQLSAFPWLIEHRTALGWTPLIVSAYNQNYDVVQLLLERGADPDVSGHNGTTPLMYAKTALEKGLTGDRRIITALIAAGADLRRTDCFGKDVFYYLEKTGASELLTWMRSLVKEAE